VNQEWHQRELYSAGRRWHLSRVAFDRQCIVRLLHGVPRSTEDEIAPNDGMISEHFACGVPDSAFWHAQCETWKQRIQPASD
jgi:hypothetical protein